MNELSFLNSLYFIIQSFITTGFGDIVPRTNAAKGVFIILNTIGASAASPNKVAEHLFSEVSTLTPSSPTGLVMFSIVISFTRATALEAMQRQYTRNETLILGRLRRRMTRSSFRRLDDTKVAGRDPVPESWPRKMKRWIRFWGPKEEEQVEQEQVEQDDEDEKKELHEQDFEEAIVELNEESRREFRAEVRSDLTEEPPAADFLLRRRSSSRLASFSSSGSSEQPSITSWRGGASLSASGSCTSR
jgi:hypothetical protein